jgi:NADH:ubiquinone oxidoreductase subunit 2 (subunit N)
MDDWRSVVTVLALLTLVIGAVLAVVGAFIYLRIMVSMWSDASVNESPLKVPVALGFAIGSTVAFTLAIGFFLRRLLDTARDLTQFASL